MRETTKLIGLFSLVFFCSTNIVRPAFGEPQEYPSQVSTDGSVTWELKSCARKQNNIVSCIVSVSRSEDGGYGIFVQNSTKLVDPEGNEYYPVKAQILKRVAGAGSLLSFDMAKGSQYKVTIDFSEVPTSVPYATLLQIAANGTITGGAKFRNLPLINFDGSISEVPLSVRSRPTQDQSTPATNNNPIITIPRICLPLIGCR